MSKKQWGNACWYLFHTLAEKLKPEYEKDIPIIIRNILSICKNLPCPVCSSHAKRHIMNIKINNINTKTELKLFLFNFHNNVNKQLGKKDDKFFRM